MYRFVVLVCGIFTAVQVHAVSEMPTCADMSLYLTHLFYRRGLECCKNDITLPTKDVIPFSSETVKECLKLMKNYPTCDVQKCVAKARGLLTDDDTMIREKMAENIEYKFENNTELAELLIDSCVYGDLTKYGPPDACILTKQGVCYQIQLVMSCKEWTDSGDCRKVKEMADTCSKEFS